MSCETSGAVEGSVASDHVQMPVLMIHRQAKMASGHPVGGEDSDYRGASGTPPPTGYGRTDCHGTMWQLYAIFLHFPLLSGTFRHYSPQIGFPLSPALLCCKICFYSNGIPRKTAGTIHKYKTKPGRLTGSVFSFQQLYKALSAALSVAAIYFRPSILSQGHGLQR